MVRSGFSTILASLLLSAVICDNEISSSCSSQPFATIDVVVASLGGPNLDGDPEDLSWLPSELDKPLYLYDRTNTNSPYYINTTRGNECLTYMRYILDHYQNLPSAVIFIHADASRHCPLITNVLQKSNHEIHSALFDSRNPIQGYLSLSKVFLNQSYSYLKGFNLGIIELSNEILTIKCNYYRQLHHDDEASNSNSPCNIPHSSDFPPYTTTYTSGSFIVARENILAIPFSFYQQVYDKLYHGEQWIDTTCGALEYVWTTLWGGIPWDVQPNYVHNWCGPLYYADISSNYGFMFYKSDDGSVEEGYIPDKYFGSIYNRENNQISVGRYRYIEEEEETQVEGE